jgi:uncharacterized protein (DUF362 family)
MKEKAGASRRDFLRNCVAGVIVAGVGGLSPLEAATAKPAAGKSKVVVARDAMLYGQSSAPDASRVQKLLDHAMQSFYRSSDPIAPWKKLVRPGEVVGLKINTLGGPALSSNSVLIAAICERLKQAGVKASDIVIWDNTNEALEHAGYKLSNNGNVERVLGSDDKSAGYEEKSTIYASVNSRFSKLLTRTCDCMINVPILKDHSLAGVTIAMKNMYGVIHNPADLHGKDCSPYIADLNVLPEIKSKFRLVICDAMTGCYEGGPGFKPQYAWKYNGLMVATDPVALDYTGWQIIERKRKEAGLKTLEEVGRPPKYIAVAADAQHRLGTNDPRRIALVEV